MQEIVVILVLALLVFGPKRLPELARSLGRGLAELRRASTDLRQTFNEATQEPRIETPQQGSRTQPPQPEASPPKPTENGGG